MRFKFQTHIKFSRIQTFLEPIVLEAEGMGFWVAMDWIKSGFGDETEISGFPLILLAGDGTERNPLLLQNAVASMFPL